MGKIKKIKIERAKERRKEGTKEVKREAILPLQVLSREDYLAAIILSTLTFVVYAFTAAPGVTLADSADNISRIHPLLEWWSMALNHVGQRSISIKD